jgi:hypothetical protein
LEPIGRVHVPVPEQPRPDQPVKIDPGEGVAVSVTGTFLPTVSEHAPGHEIPPGSLVTLPEPLPVTAVLTV